MTKNLQIEFVKIQVSVSLTTFIERKMTVLIQHYPFVKSAKMYIKKEPKHRGHVCSCEIGLAIPGSQLFAKSDMPYFETAIKDTIRQLEHQLDKAKQKLFVRRS